MLHIQQQVTSQYLQQQVTSCHIQEHVYMFTKSRHIEYLRRHVTARVGVLELYLAAQEVLPPHAGSGGERAEGEEHGENKEGQRGWFSDWSRTDHDVKMRNMRAADFSSSTLPLRASSMRIQPLSPELQNTGVNTAGGKRCPNLMQSFQKLV